MNEDRIDAYAEELYRALREARSVAPLTEREPSITLEDAYGIQRRLLERKLSRDGERIVGKKIGVTSAVVMKMLDVDRPDFGELTSAMVIPNGGTVPIAKTILARAEGEIAFRLSKDLVGPGVGPDEVLA